MKRIGRRSQRGFTLVEVVVAISLLAFGLALALGTLRGATRATERAEVVAQRDEQLRAVQGFMRSRIAAALPIAYEFDEETAQATFLRASSDKLEFVALMPGYLSRGGPYVQTFELVRGGNGRQLVFQHRQLTSDGAIAAEREPVVLLDGIAEGGFEVRNLDEQSRPGRWEDAWEATAQLPPMVRLNLRFADRARAWPTLVVATRMGVAFGGNTPEPLAGSGVDR